MQAGVFVPVFCRTAGGSPLGFGFDSPGLHTFRPPLTCGNAGEKGFCSLSGGRGL